MISNGNLARFSIDPPTSACSLAGNILEGLVWKVSVDEMKLDSIKSSLDQGFFSDSCVPLGVCLCFIDRRRLCGRMGRNRDGGRPGKPKFEALGLE